MIKIVTVIGARPQFVKAAVLSRLMRSEAYAATFSEVLVHTGQHYDTNMSDVFFREMEIPEPDVNLGVGGGTHGRMTGEMLMKIEDVLIEKKPDLVLVYGDTNSTLAGALAASKLSIPVAHVEAGLRSFNKRMPEEQNRVVSDHLSTYLFCPTRKAIENLKTEGIEDTDGPISADRQSVTIVGDVMLDASLYYQQRAAARPIEERVFARLHLPRKYRLLTLHRAENTDDRERLGVIFTGLTKADDLPIVFPMHPRTKKCLSSFGISLPSNIRVIEPVGYFDMLELEESCEAVITDSGGVQKEAYFFHKPCVTIRDQTEWVETVESGWNTLVSSACIERLPSIIQGIRPPREYPPLYGSGAAGDAVLKVIDEHLELCRGF